MSGLPLFYYPTTVVCIDDDNLTLQSISHLIKAKLKTEIKTYNNAINFLNYFSGYIPHSSTMNFLNGISADECYDLTNHLPVDLDQNIFNLNFAEIAKEEISIIIIDHQMPDMTGIELCRRLHNSKIKKILLTGEMDCTEAVQAFNKGIIDCYLNKGSTTVVNDLLNYVELLSNKYLSELSDKLLSYLETDIQIPHSDPIFIKFFNDWCSKMKIKEHYIFDKFGNMRLIDHAGKRFNFVIHTDNTLNNFLEFYNESTNSLSLTEAVDSRKVIPFFGVGVDAWQLEVSDWDNHFFEPNVLQGRENYYWIVNEVR